MIAGLRNDRGPANPPHPAAAGPHGRARRALCHGRDREGRGAVAGTSRAPHQAAVLRPGQAGPQGGAGARRGELVLSRRAADRGHGLPDDPAAHPGADHLRPAAGVHGRHPGRRVPALAGQLRGGHRRVGDRQPVRPDGLEPGQDVLGHHRAGGAVRGVHRGPADRHRPAVRAGRHGPVQRRADHPPGAPAGRRCAVHGDPARDRPDPGGDAHRHQRVRHDRGGPELRALRPVLRAAEVGQRAQAADPVHDPGRRVPGAVGPGLDPEAGRGRAGHRGPAGQGVRGRLRGRGDRQLLRQAAPVQDHRVRLGRVPARRPRRVHALPGGWLMLTALIHTAVIHTALIHAALIHAALIRTAQTDPVQAPGVYEGVATVIAAVMLLLEFGMLRQALVRDQIRLYMGQSALLSVLAVVIAADRNLPDLYALAALSAALKVVAVPLVMRRLLGRTESQEGEDAPGVAGSQTLSPASSVLAGIVLAAVGFFCFGALKISGPAAPALALSLAGAMVLVAFGLMIVRRDVASQAIGFFSLENAISLAALVVASGLPLILETAFLFDLLVAVVVFTMLIRAHHTRTESLSTADLTKLQG